MRHPRSPKPGSIANVQSKIQIVDTQESIETRFSISFPAFPPQMNRTLLFQFISELRMASNMETVMNGEGARRPSEGWDPVHYTI